MTESSPTAMLTVPPRAPAGKAGPEPVTVGIDIGGTSVRAGAVDADHHVLDLLRAPTAHTVDELDATLVELIGRLADQYPVASVGLAIAGFLSADRSQVMFAPHLPWRNDPVAQRLTDRCGVPVVMEHDVNAAAWAEYRAGAAMGSSISMLLALGTGIGAGLVIDGTLYRGFYGVAPEWGHLVVVPDGRPCPCGKRGCWERYCSGTALLQTYREFADGAGDAVSGADVATLGRAGDATAVAALTDFGRWLGIGLSMIADVLDPELVVVGGGVSAASELFLPIALDTMAASLTGTGHRPVAEVRIAHFGGTASVIGAAELAREALPEKAGR